MSCTQSQRSESPWFLSDRAPTPPTSLWVQWLPSPLSSEMPWEEENWPCWNTVIWWQTEVPLSPIHQRTQWKHWERLQTAEHQISLFRSQRTLHSLLTRVKNKPAKEKVKGVIYRVHCSCGYTYVGETSRTLEIRLKEHKRTVRTDQSNNGIAVHANKTWHSILWDSAEVLDW